MVTTSLHVSRHDGTIYDRSRESSVFRRINDRFGSVHKSISFVAKLGERIPDAELNAHQVDGLQQLKPLGLRLIVLFVGKPERFVRLSRKQFDEQLDL